jgi:hypothetical protein
MTLDEVRALLLREMAEFEGTGARGRRGFGLRGWCEFHGVASGHVSEFLHGKRGPQADLLRALGLEWEVVRKKSREAAE